MQQLCKHVELEQFLACFRVARVCQRQLGFLVHTYIQYLLFLLYMYNSLSAVSLSLVLKWAAMRCKWVIGWQERPRSRAMDAEERGRRRHHDDALLDEVKRAAVDAFPLLPPTRGVGSSPSSGRASRDRDVEHHGTERRRRQAPAPAQTETTHVDVRPWQMSHVRQYDVIDGYPVHRPWRHVITWSTCRRRRAYVLCLRRLVAAADH